MGRPYGKYVGADIKRKILPGKADIAATHQDNRQELAAACAASEAPRQSRDVPRANRTREIFVKLHFRSVLFTLLLVTSWAHAQEAKPAARAAAAPQTASDMTALYYSTPTNCASAGGTQPDVPAYLCSGLLLRYTTPGNYHSWSPSPTDESVGGVSFIYVRSDVKTNWFMTPNGFSIYPVLGPYRYQGSTQKKRLNVVCAFPLDGGTSHRGLPSGCAQSAVGVPGPMCQGMGIYTADQWVANYQKTSERCGFDVRTGASVAKVSREDIDAADAFMQMIYAVGKLGAFGFSDHTEIRIAAWPETWNAEVPIQSFWYTGAYKGTGWTNARNDQTDYYNTTGEFVPVIKMKAPATSSEDYTFHYYADDQAVPVPKN